MFNAAANQLIVLFALMIVGYVAAKLGQLDEIAQRRLSNLIIKVALPASFIAASRMDSQPEHLGRILQICLIAFIFYLASFAMIWLLSAKFIRQRSRRVFLTFSATYGNVIFMGYPIVRSALGDEAIFFASFFTIFFNLSLFILAPIFMGAGGSVKLKQVLLQPALIGIAIMLLLFGFQLKLPQPLHQTMAVLGELCTPLSMLVIGGQIAAVRLRELFTQPLLYVMSAVRLLVLPLILALVLKLIGIPDDVSLMAVLLNAMPVASMVSILADQYDCEAELTSSGVAQSMLFSLPSLLLVMKLAELFFPG